MPRFSHIRFNTGTGSDWTSYASMKQEVEAEISELYEETKARFERTNRNPEFHFNITGTKPATFLVHMQGEIYNSLEIANKIRVLKFAYERENAIDIKVLAP